jgi:hypothetical protein
MSEIPPTSSGFPNENQVPWQPYPYGENLMPSSQNNTQQTNGFAVAAIIFGVIGFFSCGLAGIFGIAFGILGRKKARRTGSGAGLSLAGIILGIISIVVSVIIIVLLATNTLKVGKEATTDFEKQKQEIRYQQFHGGKSADKDEYEITNEITKVDNNSETKSKYYVTYDANIKNTSGSKKTFRVYVGCTGHQSDKDQYIYMLPGMVPDERRDVHAIFNFDEIPQAIKCSVIDVKK